MLLERKVAFSFFGGSRRGDYIKLIWNQCVGLYNHLLSLNSSTWGGHCRGKNDRTVIDWWWHERYMRKEKGELTRLENSKHRRKVALFKKKIGWPRRSRFRKILFGIYWVAGKRSRLKGLKRAWWLCNMSTWLGCSFPRTAFPVRFWLVWKTGRSLGWNLFNRGKVVVIW